MSKYHYPTPEEAGITIPPTLNAERFREGFEHGLKSNQLTKFQKSYAEGFRAAKLYCRELRKRQGIVNFPKMKFKLSVVDGE